MCSAPGLTSQKHSRLARLERFAILLVSSYSMASLHLPQAAQSHEPQSARFNACRGQPLKKTRGRPPNRLPHRLPTVNPLRDRAFSLVNAYFSKCECFFRAWHSLSLEKVTRNGSFSSLRVIKTMVFLMNSYINALAFPYFVKWELLNGPNQ